MVINQIKTIFFLHFLLLLCNWKTKRKTVLIFNYKKNGTQIPFRTSHCFFVELQPITVYDAWQYSLFFLFDCFQFELIIILSHLSHSVDNSREILWPISCNCQQMHTYTHIRSSNCSTTEKKIIEIEMFVNMMREKREAKMKKEPIWIFISMNFRFRQNISVSQIQIFNTRNHSHGYERRKKY